MQLTKSAGWALALTSVAFFMTALDALVVITALPAIHASLGGPLVGGAVVQGLDWHWIFWLNVPIGLAAAGLSISRLPESRGPAARLDLPGVAMVTIGAVALAWGLVRTSAVGWGNPQVIGALILAAVLIAGFVTWERRASEPMLPMRLLRIRTFSAANATGLLMMASITSAAFLMSQYFQLGLGHSALSTGLRFLPWTLTPLLIAPAAGSLADKIGARPLMVVGLAMQGAGLGWIALSATDTSGYGGLVLPLLPAGVPIPNGL